MKAYPLIYSRTKFFDFVPDFLARPADLDCEAALKYVKNAMNGLDMIQDIRYTAFAAGQYCVCGGIACISVKLFDKLAALSPEFASGYPDASEYLRDCKGRNLACFIGMAIPKDEIQGDVVPDISLEKYWEIYLQYLKHQWTNETNTASEKLESPVIEVEEKQYSASFRPQEEKFGHCSVIRNYKSHEREVLDYFFHAILNGSGDSFITGIQKRGEWDALNFSIAAVSDSLYHALKLNPVKTSMPNSSLWGGNTLNSGKESYEVKISHTPIPEPGGIPNKEPKKTPNPSLKLVIAAIIILAVLLLLIKR